MATPAPTHHPWLSRYAWLTAGATLGLICLGGLVTSHGVGMAVPDWPTTYGYNMFFFPISKWVGGIFYEHTHRLAASAVGLMTLVLAGWVWMVERRRWMRWLGVIAALSVILQGVLGGLRVIAMLPGLGVVHATLAQLFLVQVSVLALCLSRGWLRREARPGPVLEGQEASHQPHPLTPSLSPGGGEGARRTGEGEAARFQTGEDLPQDAIASPKAICVSRRTVHLYGTVTGMILVQLVLGALMRHQHAGLAVPDFPAAYGRVWPAMDATSIDRYNQLRMEARDLNPITAGGVALHMAHRLNAGLILLGVAGLAWSAMRRWGWQPPLTRFSVAWLGLILCQVVLGAATVWTNKSADITTAHVAVGSLSLVTGALLLLVTGRPACASVGTDAPGRDALVTGRSLPA